MRSMADADSLLSRAKLSNTVQRRAMLTALSHASSPMTHADIRSYFRQKNIRIDTATIYRILKQFLLTSIVHKHPSSNGYVLCSLESCHGHHGFLTCSACQSVTEFSDAALCHAEHSIARSHKFQAQTHVTDLVGLCANCQ